MDNRHPTVAAGAAGLLDTSSSLLAQVLDQGDIDEWSRSKLTGLYQALSAASALLEPQPTTGGRSDYSRHPGSIEAIYWRVPTHAREVISKLAEQESPWLDELDRLTDSQLLGFPGIGPVTLAKLRHELAAYFWRGDDAASRKCWNHIKKSLQLWLDYPYLGRQRERVEQGIAFAEKVIRTNGAPLANPRAVRLEVV
jgi:plasmid stabilization system protein ParE